MTKLVKSFVFLLVIGVIITGCSKDEEPEEILPPVADFILSNDVHPAPCNVSFDNTSENLSNCTWDFGDGTVSHEVHPDHVFTTGGTYSVKLTVTNKAGEEDMVFKTVSIPEKPTRMKILGIELNKIPLTNPGGESWDPADAPDVFFYILDETNVPLMVTECKDNLSEDLLPAYYNAGFPLVFYDLGFSIKISAYDRDTGPDAPDDFLGSQTISLASLIPKNGEPYPSYIVFNNPSNPLGFNVVLDWD